jgi:hypothetical protein
MTAPAPYDHYRSVGDDHPDGVYRVVGVGERVTLLYVGAADGTRVVDGRVIRVPPSTFESAFEPAENPDSGVRLRRVPAAVVEWIVATLRMWRRWLP